VLLLDGLQQRLERGYGLRWDDDRARHLSRALGHPSAAADIQAVLDALLIGETYFFRYPFYLQLLRQQMAARPAGAPFRVLCPACSSGEEVYSLAFALRDDAHAQARRLEIVGTDARESAVATARAAIYTAWSLRSTEASVRDRLLEPAAEGRFRVREPYRTLPSFAVRNLLEPPASGPFDAVLLPNATLYMQPEGAATVYRNLARAIVVDGLLLLAPTDPIPREPWRRHEQHQGWAVFGTTAAAEPPAVDETPVERPRPAPPAPSRPVEERREEDERLWAAWASGRLGTAHDRIRELVFHEPGEPLWRFLHGAVLWERGWLRRARKEMDAAARLLGPLPPERRVRGLCTARELSGLVEFWSEQHG
jgi:chemotaxis protein methyltransferase CheR